MRTHTLDTIQIPEDVWWADEFDWTPIEQSTTRGLTGARIVQQGIKQGGRPITLASNERGGWVPRATVLALKAQRDTPDQTWLLTLADGRTFTVAHDVERDFEAVPVRPVADMDATTHYRITLPLIEV